MMVRRWKCDDCEAWIDTLAASGSISDIEFCPYCGGDGECVGLVGCVTGVGEAETTEHR